MNSRRFVVDKFFLLFSGKLLPGEKNVVYLCIGYSNFQIRRESFWHLVFDSPFGVPSTTCCRGEFGIRAKSLLCRLCFPSFVRCVVSIVSRTTTWLV